MSDLRKKLHLKELPVKVVNIPQDLKDIKEELTTITDLVADGLLIFHTTALELQQDLEKLLEEYRDGYIWWFCYPKKSSKLYKNSDLSRQNYFDDFTSFGFRPVSQISLNDNWTATRIRKISEVK